MKIKIILHPSQEIIDNLDYDIKVLIIILDCDTQIKKLYGLPILLKYLIISSDEYSSVYIQNIVLPYKCDVNYCLFEKCINYNESGQLMQDIKFRINDIKVVKILKSCYVKNNIDFIADADYEKLKYKLTKKCFSISMTEC